MCSCDNHMLLITGQLIFSPSIIITLKPNIFKEGVGSWGGGGHAFSPPPPIGYALQVIVPPPPSPLPPNLKLVFCTMSM